MAFCLDSRIALLMVVLMAGLPAADSWAGEGSTPAAREAIKTIYEKYPNTGRGYADAQALLPYLKHPDPDVRRTAYGTAMTAASFNTAEQVLALVDAAAAEKDPGVREEAEKTVRSLSIRDSSLYNGVDQKVVPKLEQLALASDRDSRLKTIRVLEQLAARSPKTYCTLLRDKDVEIKLAAVRATGQMLSKLQGSEKKLADEPGAVLCDALIADPRLLEEGGLVLCKAGRWLAGTPKLLDTLAKLDRSKDLDQRAVATMVRKELNGFKDDWGGVTRDRVAEGVRCRFAWVRAMATDALFRRVTPIEPVDGRAILIQAIDDPNAGVATDAVFRLCNALSVSVGNTTYTPASAYRLEQRVSASDLPKPPAEFASPSPQVRLNALKTFTRTRRDQGPLVATRLFDDPDPKVRQGARAEAKALILQRPAQ